VDRVHEKMIAAHCGADENLERMSRPGT